LAVTFDYIQNAATADALGAFWLAEWKRLRVLVEGTTFWNVMAWDNYDPRPVGGGLLPAAGDRLSQRDGAEPRGRARRATAPPGRAREGVMALDLDTFWQVLAFLLGCVAVAIVVILVVRKLGEAPPPPARRP
jgi:hypothetical protein